MELSVSNAMINVRIDDHFLVRDCIELDILIIALFITKEWQYYFPNVSQVQPEGGWGLEVIFLADVRTEWDLKISLARNTQLLITWQHAYQSFLSHFLVLFPLQYCGILGEFILDKNVNMNKNYSYRTTIY